MSRYLLLVRHVAGKAGMSATLVVRRRRGLRMAKDSPPDWHAVELGLEAVLHPHNRDGLARKHRLHHQQCHWQRGHLNGDTHHKLDGVKEKVIGQPGSSRVELPADDLDGVVSVDVVIH